MTREDNDRVERPPPRRRGGASNRSSNFELGVSSPGASANVPQAPTNDRPDPLADLAPVYSVDELAPVYGDAQGKADQTGQNAITSPRRGDRSQPMPARARPSRAPTPGTTPVSMRGSSNDDQRLNDDTELDENDDAPRWPRLLILTVGLLTSLGIIAYGVSGLFSTTSNDDPNAPSEESSDDETTSSDAGFDLEPVSIQGEPLEVQNIDLPDQQLQVRRIFSFGESTAVVGTHPNNPERRTIAVLDRSSRAWTEAPSELVFAAVGPTSDGLIGIADNNGGFAAVESTDSGASWTPVEGIAQLPSPDLDLIAGNDSAVVFAKSEVVADHRGEASTILASAGIELPANMIAGVSAENITYFEGGNDDSAWWTLPSYTVAWSDFGLEAQPQWAAYGPEAPRRLYRWAGAEIEEIPDPFGADQFLLSVDTIMGEFRAKTYDATSIGFSEWRSPDGATWTTFGSLTRPAFAQAPPSAIQRVSLDGVEWQILTVPERDPVLARRATNTQDWEMVDAATVIDGTDLSGYRPSSIAVTDRVLTLVLDGPDGKASVVAQSVDAASWKVADIDAPHIEASVDSGSLLAFGTDIDPALGPPTLGALGVG